MRAAVTVGAHTSLSISDLQQQGHTSYVFSVTMKPAPAILIPTLLTTSVITQAQVSEEYLKLTFFLTNKQKKEILTSPFFRIQISELGR